MMRNGVTIFFDDEGKKNKDLSVQYPIVKKRQALDIEKIKKMRENGNRQEMLQKMMASLGTDIKIFEDGEERIINKEFNNEGISGDFKIALKDLSYTLKVPLSYVKNDYKNSSIGIKLKGMQMPDMANRPSARMRGGGMRGGGRPGGMAGGQRPDMSKIKALQSDTEIWIPIVL